MPIYSVRILPSALRQLAELPRHDQKRLSDRVDRLANDPHPIGVKKLKGEPKLFRIRVGNYRIMYSIEQGRRVGLVIRIGHRRNVYRGL